MPKKKKGSLLGDITGFTQAGVGLGVGSAVVAGAGAASGQQLGGGLAAVGGMMPTVGTTMMGRRALMGVQSLSPKKKKKLKLF